MDVMRHHRSGCDGDDALLCWCWQDECTDAVSIDVEEGLYKSMSDAGVTIITISKYAALKRIGIFCCNCVSPNLADILCNTIPPCHGRSWLTFFCPSEWVL